ncbi:MAG: hypothetical protein QOG43_473 [Actinomycetota bacterium]|nr:hypothetical protein [Actinomycetota bacterium]
MTSVQDAYNRAEHHQEVLLNPASILERYRNGELELHLHVRIKSLDDSGCFGDSCLRADHPEAWDSTHLDRIDIEVPLPCSVVSYLLLETLSHGGGNRPMLVLVREMGQPTECEPRPLNMRLHRIHDLYEVGMHSGEKGSESLRGVPTSVGSDRESYSAKLRISQCPVRTADAYEVPGQMVQGVSEVLDSVPQEKPPFRPRLHGADPESEGASVCLTVKFLDDREGSYSVSVDPPAKFSLEFIEMVLRSRDLEPPVQVGFHRHSEHVRADGVADDEKRGTP